MFGSPNQTRRWRTTPTIGSRLDKAVCPATCAGLGEASDGLCNGDGAQPHRQEGNASSELEQPGIQVSNLPDFIGTSLIPVQREPVFLGAVKINAVIDHGLRQDDTIARMLVEKNQRGQSGEGMAVEDFETEGEKQWKVTPMACRAAGVP